MISIKYDNKARFMDSYSDNIFLQLAPNKARVIKTLPVPTFSFTIFPNKQTRLQEYGVPHRGTKLTETYPQRGLFTR